MKIDDVLDTEGRPLGEHRASAAVRAAVPTVLKACPYHDSRLDHAQPMNVSALKQLTSHWQPALAGISQVRAAVLVRYPQQPLRTLGVLRVAETVAALPHYLVEREREITPVVAAMYKIIIGIARVARVLLSGEMMGAGIEKARAVKSADLWEFADLGGFLIGSEQVCAGSARQIEEAIECVISGGDHPRDLQLDDDFFTFADGRFRIEAATFLANARATIETTGDPAVTDPHGTIQQFVKTRNAAAIAKLLAGWSALSAIPAR